jgi:hypothetical protein
MNENIKYGAAAVAVVGLTVGAILFFPRGAGKDPPAAPVVAAPAPAAVPAPEEPAIRNPVPATDTGEALPSLDDSSPLALSALTDLIGKESVERFIVTDQLIRHIVVTIDNLPNPKVAERLRPVKKVTGEFAATGSEEQPVLDPANYQRYDAMVQLIRATDTERLVAAYSRYYPLFQEAYESLGHPPEYFNDRVIEVIDVLLATPEVSGPVALARPGVLYEYADPKLESLGAGQKALIRMGSDNAAVVKEKLRELRAALAAGSPAMASP